MRPCVVVRMQHVIVIVLVFHIWRTLLVLIMCLGVHLLVLLADSLYVSCATKCLWSCLFLIYLSGHVITNTNVLHTWNANTITTICFRRTTTYGRINEGILWNCIHCRKCSSFQQQFSKYLMMTISVETYSEPMIWKIIKKTWILRY
jgi:hypothetical protein